MLEWTLDSRFKVRVGVRRETALEVVIPKLATVGKSGKLQCGGGWEFGGMEFVLYQ